MNKRGSAVVLVCARLCFESYFPEFTPSLKPISAKFIFVIPPNAFHSGARGR